MTDRLPRRAYLRLAGLAAVTGLAGCAGGGAGSDPDPTTTATTTTERTTDAPETTTTTTADPNSLAGHASTAGLESQPYLGAAPSAEVPVIVAFEDPSCPTCRRFEAETLPELRSNLLEEEAASFVFRGVGIIYDWGEPAAKLLEATLARDEGAHWDLKDHYYATQSEFGVDTVFDRTRSFLSEETEVDADAVVEAARSGDVDAAYTTDLDAATAAGISATPTFFLFRDGEYVTTAQGAVGYPVFANALGV